MTKRVLQAKDRALATVKTDELFKKFHRGNKNGLNIS